MNNADLIKLAREASLETSREELIKIAQLLINALQHEEADL